MEPTFPIITANMRLLCLSTKLSLLAVCEFVLVTKLVFTQRPHNAACKKTKESRTFTKIQYYSSDIKGFDWYFSELSLFMWNKDNVLTAGLQAYMQGLIHTTTFLWGIALKSCTEKNNSFN